MEESTGKKETKKFEIKFKSWIMVLIVVVSLSLAGYFWNDAREAKQQTPDAVAARNLEETDQVVNELKTVLLIEGDQQPTVARVEEPTVLQNSNPDFYKNIEVGDYLVLYPQRAIIYRTSNKQIINLAPIINTDQLNQQSEDQTTQDITEGQ